MRLVYACERLCMIMISPLVSECVKRTITGLILVLCFGGAYFHSITLFSFLLLGVLFIMLAFEWPKLVPFANPFLIIALTLLYPILPMISLVILNKQYHHVSILLPLYPFLIAWTQDTFGYIFGKTFGKNKMCPTISPGKSWEGFAGSIFGVTIMNFITLPNIEINPFHNYFYKISFLMFVSVLIISIILTICAFLGGLFLSYLKRRKGLKDAGIALPGHGGFLDRFDSVMPMALITWITLLLR